MPEHQCFEKMKNIAKRNIFGFVSFRSGLIIHHLQFSSGAMLTEERQHQALRSLARRLLDYKALLKARASHYRGYCSDPLSKKCFCRFLYI